MAHKSNFYEQRILETLRRHRTMTLEGLVTAVPDLSWNCVFHTVDELSRDGRITMHRQGFDYEVSLHDSLSHWAPPSA